jgi:hypothetical protein
MRENLSGLPITQDGIEDDFVTGLQAWVNSAEPGELRAEAMQRIIDAKRNGSTKLSLAKLGLSSIPEQIGNLNALTTLDLGNNRLTKLPESIGGLNALTILSLSDNRLTTLPELIGGLNALTVLDLFNNQLTKLPESIGGLNALRDLNLSNNQLTKLPESIGGLNALTFLNLFNNQLTTLLESIGGLNALRDLNLGKNRLTTLLESIGGLNALTFLNLSNNQLTTLPESIGGLNALTTLDLDSNPLTTLPESIGGLNALTFLDLDSNPLTPSPTLLDRLSELETRGCDIRYPNEITSEVRADRAEWRLQQSRLQQVSRTLSVASCNPKSYLSQLEYGVMAEVIKFTDTRLLSEEEKKAVFEATEKGLKETDMYKRYVEANSTADNQELETKSVTASPTEVIASEENEERSYKSDYEDSRSSEERLSSHQAYHQGDGGAAAEEEQETAAITETSRERAEEPRVDATATASPTEVIASEEAKAEKYKSDSEELRSSEERPSSHQASHQSSHQGDGGAAAEEGQETAAITETSRERAEEPRVDATASRTFMGQVCDSLSSPFRSSSKVHPEPSMRTTTSAPQPLTKKGKKVTPSK